MDVLRGAIQYGGLARVRSQVSPSLANIRLVFTAGRFYCAGVLCRDGWDGTSYVIASVFLVFSAAKLRKRCVILGDSSSTALWSSAHGTAFFMLFIVLSAEGKEMGWVVRQGCVAHHVFTLYVFVYREFFMATWRLLSSTRLGWAQGVYLGIFSLRR